MSATPPIVDRETWQEQIEARPQLYLGTYSEQMRIDEHGRSVGRPGGRPIPQWPRLAAGHSDDLGSTTVSSDTHHSR